MTRIAVNGIDLNVDVRGQGPPLLLLHGFTGSTVTWKPLAGTLPDFATIAVDVIGHGASDSPPDPGRYSMQQCFEDLIALLNQLAIGATALLGYSMGARIALHFAISAPERLSALVLESSSPGIEDSEERQARVQSDNDLAGLIETRGLTAFVDYWQSIPLFGSQRRLPAAQRLKQREQRLTNNPLGLANSLRGMGAGMQAPLFGRLSEIAAPALIITGALDEKYCALGRRMAAAIAGSRLEIVEDAGHAVHLEEPAAFSQAVRAFLESVEQGSALGQRKTPLSDSKLRQGASK